MPSRLLWRHCNVVSECQDKAQFKYKVPNGPDILAKSLNLKMKVYQFWNIPGISLICENIQFENSRSWKFQKFSKYVSSMWKDMK